MKPAANYFKSIVALSSLLIVSATFAHHSFGMFDRSREIKITGVVKNWQLTNPHSWLDLVVVNASGAEEAWAFEGGSINQLVRQDVKPSTFKPGDKVTVSAFPLRDGRKGGHVTSVLASDGKTYEMFPSAFGTEPAGNK